MVLSVGYIKEKWQHAGFQKYLRNTGWMFFAKICSMVITFISTAYIARNLGPLNYGELSYAISFTSLFGFLASFGIDAILYRDLVKFPEKRNSYMGTAVALRLMTGVIATVICVGSAIMISAKDVSLLLIFVISLTFVFGAFQLLNYEFQAEAKVKYPSILLLFVVLILNILKVLTILYGHGVIYLALILLLEPILYAVGYIYFRITKIGSISNWRYDGSLAFSILKDSYPIIFATSFFAIYSRIDQVMIKNLLDTNSVGLYSAAVSISEVWYFIPNIIMSAVFPAIINAKKTSEDLYNRRTRKLFFLLISISFLIALPTAMFSKYFINIIYGSHFIGAVVVLQIYIWSNIGATLNALTQQILVTENLTKMITLTAFLGMLSNVGLNFLLIPAYGMSGAAYASLFSYLVPFLSLLLFTHTRKIIFNIFDHSNARI